jgi:hypothetical protein
MPTTPATGDPTVEEQFLNLICNDPDLLAAEFDAIIAAAWPTPPADGPGRPAADPVRDPVHRPRHPGIGGRVRQRSPPL